MEKNFSCVKLIPFWFIILRWRYTYNNAKEILYVVKLISFNNCIICEDNLIPGIRENSLYDKLLSYDEYFLRSLLKILLWQGQGKLLVCQTGYLWFGKY